MQFPIELKTTDGRTAVILGMNEYYNFIGYIKGSSKSCRWYSDTYTRALGMDHPNLIRPIQLKEGGLYRMRNGNKVRITWKTNGPNNDFFGYTKPNTFPGQSIWQSNGECIVRYTFNNPRDYDIVEEIPE